MREKNKAAVELGRKGGAKTAIRGKEYYQAIGRKGNKAQGKKVSRASKKV
jgi:general stress protein YciG